VAPFYIIGNLPRVTKNNTMDTKPYYSIKKMSPLFVVADLSRSIEFYKTRLGFNLDFLYEDFYAGVIKDGCSIHLKCGKPNEEERQSKRDKEHIDMTFSIDNIEHLHEAFISDRMEFVQPLRQMPYGKEFYIADPDGYIIAFLEEA